MTGAPGRPTRQDAAVAPLADKRTPADRRTASSRRSPSAPGTSQAERTALSLSDRHYAGLLAARTGLAAFVQLSERDARAVGATHAQHHVLLALRGHNDETAPTVKDIATALGIASPSAVELIARMVAAGLLRRQDDPSDRRVTRLRLTRLGDKILRQLSETHLPRLRELHRRGSEFLAD